MEILSRQLFSAGGRTALMRQVMAGLGAIKANPSLQHAITLVFPTDKVSGIVDVDA